MTNYRPVPLVEHIQVGIDLCTQKCFEGKLFLQVRLVQHARTCTFWGVAPAQIEGCLARFFLILYFSMF